MKYKNTVEFVPTTEQAQKLESINDTIKSIINDILGINTTSNNGGTTNG